MACQEILPGQKSSVFARRHLLQNLSEINKYTTFVSLRQAMSRLEKGFQSHQES